MASPLANTLDPIERLPAEINVQIFSLLPGSTLAASSRVSKGWDAFLQSQSEPLWHASTLQDYKPKVCAKPSVQHPTWMDVCECPDAFSRNAPELSRSHPDKCHRATENRFKNGPCGRTDFVLPDQIGPEDLPRAYQIKVDESIGLGFVLSEEQGYLSRDRKQLTILLSLRISPK